MARRRVGKETGAPPPVADTRAAVVAADSLILEEDRPSIMASVRWDGALRISMRNRGLGWLAAIVDRRTAHALGKYMSTATPEFEALDLIENTLPMCVHAWASSGAGGVEAAPCKNRRSTTSSGKGASMNKERFEGLRRLHQGEADHTVLLEAFGSDLAEREGYTDIDGIEAVHLYLIRKYGWLPRDVLTMRPSELRLALRVEMQGWTLRPDLR